MEIKVENDEIIIKDVKEERVSLDNIDTLIKNANQNKIFYQNRSNHYQKREKKLKEIKKEIEESEETNEQ